MSAYAYDELRYLCNTVCFSRSGLTGKERDPETGEANGNDYFGARYYASSMGRFMSPDWSATVEPVPYSKLDDPQSLNLYAYMLNNPLGGVDPDGHCGVGPSDPCTASQQACIDMGKCDPGSLKAQQTDTQAQQQMGQDPTLPTEVQQSISPLDKALGPTPSNMLMVLTGDLGEIGEAGKVLSSVAEESVSVYQKAETAYVGITKNLAAREAQHGEPLVKVVGDLTRKQARGVEQAIIENKGLANLTNKINSIAKTNPIYQEAVQFGKQLLKSIGFE